jgi:hypothetical protein
MDNVRGYKYVEHIYLFYSQLEKQLALRYNIKLLYPFLPSFILLTFVPQQWPII